jgi:hypothetical protein
MSKYNGWANRDTWLCFTWIVDHHYNYSVLSKMKRDDVVAITADMVRYRFYFGDRIDFDHLDLPELRNALLEHHEGLTQRGAPRSF